jgi:hypothetical protein
LLRPPLPLPPSPLLLLPPLLSPVLPPLSLVLPSPPLLRSLAPLLLPPRRKSRRSNPVSAKAKKANFGWLFFA